MTFTIDTINPSEYTTLSTTDNLTDEEYRKESLNTIDIVFMIADFKLN